MSTPLSQFRATPGASIVWFTLTGVLFACAGRPANRATVVAASACDTGPSGCGSNASDAGLDSAPADAGPRLACDGDRCRTAGQLVVGSSHSCAIVHGGRVWCWGSNDHGQLGRGTVSSVELPDLVTGLDRVRELAIGSWHTCARREDGAVACWGKNDRGQLGDGTTTSHPAPVRVAGLAAAAQISSGPNAVCALTRAGAVWCWGVRFGVPFPNAGRAFETGPIQVDVGFVAAGVGVGGRSACAFAADGRIACWGERLYRDRNATMIDTIARPRVIATVPGVVSIHMSGDYGCALVRDGTARCWGRRFYGTHELIFDDEAVPVPGVDDLAQLVASGAGSDFAIGLRRDGTLVGFGFASWLPQDRENSARPVPAPANVVALAVDDRRVCARDTDDRIWCWGDNEHAQLGTGSVEVAWIRAPAQIAAPGTITAEQWRLRLADGAGDACSTAAECGWSPSCAPMRCVATAHVESQTCTDSMPPPGQCSCTGGRCVMRPSAVSAPEGDCTTARCGLDQSTGRCLVGAGLRGLQRGGADGPACFCNAAHRCEYTWIDAVPCRTSNDCWFEHTPVIHAIRRPRGIRRFRPCVDGESAPACIDGVCGFGPSYGC